MKPPPRHRNIHPKRLILDLYQFIRAQSFMVKCFGRQFTPDRKYIEIDITYKCNLKCINCNRSCTQSPSHEEMPVSMIEDFIQQSVRENIQWKRIRILGGEPALHGSIFEIVDLLVNYRSVHNPGVRLIIGTNYYGQNVLRVLEKLPSTVAIKSTLKTSRTNLFKPFNVAPVDTWFNRFSDYSCGCRIISDCGLGLTPSGYYMCAVAGGIDRIFRLDLGRNAIPDSSDSLTDQMRALCKLCGHFGFLWPVKKEKISRIWREAYTKGQDV